jgi:hypothetical protein
MHKVLSEINLTENFSFDTKTHENILEICKRRFYEQRPSYKKENLREFSLELDEEIIQLIPANKIAIKSGNGDENDNDGQAGGKNQEYGNILNSLSNSFDIQEPSMSVIRTPPEMLDDFNGKEYIIADGRTRWEILTKVYNCQNGPFTVYSLTKNSKNDLKRALAFLTHGKNAENNSSVCSLQNRESIVLAVSKLIIDNVIELDINKEKYKDFPKAAETVESIFGQNRIFRVKDKKKKIQAILDSALAKTAELDSSFMRNQIVWNSKKLSAWVSGIRNNEVISEISSTPVCFVPAIYHPVNPKICISKGIVVRLHDINSQNDFWRSITQHRRNWTTDKKHQTADMKESLQLLGRKIEDENIDDYVLNIVLYKQSISASEMSKSNMWAAYTTSLQNFMKFQLNFQRNILADSLPNLKNLSNTSIENFSGQNRYRIVGAAPSCINYQNISEIVPYNPNPENGEYFEFDATLRENSYLPVSPNVVPMRRHHKKNSLFEKNSVISYGLF